MAAPSVDWRPDVREAARIAAKGMQGKWSTYVIQQTACDHQYNELFRAYMVLQGCRAGLELNPAYMDEETFCRLVERWRHAPHPRAEWGYLDDLLELFAKNDEAWFRSHYTPDRMDKDTVRELYYRCGQMIGFHDDYNREENPADPEIKLHQLYRVFQTPEQTERRRTIGWSSSHWIFMRRRQQEQPRARMHRADLATDFSYKRNVPHELVQLIGSFASAAVTPQHPLLPRMQAPSVREYADRGKSVRKAEAEVEDEPPAKR